jgi:hypothetical protein
MDLRDISPELVLVDPELAPLARLLLPEPGAFRPGAPPAAAVQATECVVPRMERPPARTRRRTAKKSLLVLATVSLTLNAVFIRHAQSSVPTPSLLPDIRCSRTGCDSPLLQPAARALRSHASSSRRVAAASSSEGINRARKHEQTSQSLGGATMRRQAKPRVVVPKRSVRHVTAPHRVVPHGTKPNVRWKSARGATYYNLVLWRHGRRVLDLWPASPHAALPESSTYHGVHFRLRAGSYRWFVYPGFGAKASRHYAALAESGILIVGKPRGKT